MPSKEIIKEIDNLKKLLQKEKEEDLYQYQLKISGTSISDRRKEGICWYPVKTERTTFDMGERLLVRISRPKEHTHAHFFQSGKLVSLFSNTENEMQDAVTGVINQLRDNEMIITLNSDEIPDWLSDKNLGVQLLFDENSYREMEFALKYLSENAVGRVGELLNILLGTGEARFYKENDTILPWLNESQNNALNLVLSALDTAIIHGPPGTGKTTTIIQAILQTLKKERQILVCAPSNAAVDLLVEKLDIQGVDVVRIGHPARVTENILRHTLDARITQHHYYKDLKSARKQSQEYFNLAYKYKRNFGPEEREQRRLLISEAHKLKKEAAQLEFFIVNDIVENAQVVACTLVGAANQSLKGKRFKTVFIDEAAQSLEPAAWIPIIKSERIIFAGDHHQLPPTVKSFAAAKGGLEITLFEKAIQRNTADVMLAEQYRMNSQIMAFSSRYFYNNKLTANAKVADWKIFGEDMPIEFIDTAGCGFGEQSNGETKSRYNPEEADLLKKHLTHYLNQLEYNGQIEKIENIGIISPYSAQTVLLKSLLAEDELFSDEIRSKMSINTVDSFQGQERDIIYISLVRSNEKSEIGFLADIRRMNVAMTRARKKLVVVGDSGTICNNSFYQQFVDYCTSINAYKSGFEYLY